MGCIFLSHACLWEGSLDRVDEAGLDLIHDSRLSELVHDPTGLDDHRPAGTFVSMPSISWNV